MLARVPVDFHLGQQLGRDMLRGDDQTGKTKAVAGMGVFAKQRYVESFPLV